MSSGDANDEAVVLVPEPELETETNIEIDTQTHTDDNAEGCTHLPKPNVSEPSNKANAAKTKSKAKAKVHAAPGRAGDADAANDHVQKTVFATGFPRDVRYREIYNLFRFRDGFVRCDVSCASSNGIPVAFVSFSSHAHADKCIQDLNSLQFDPEVKFLLRLEFAKSNTSAKKRTRTANYDTSALDKRVRVGGGYYRDPPAPSPSAVASDYSAMSSSPSPSPVPIATHNPYYPAHQHQLPHQHQHHPHHAGASFEYNYVPTGPPQAQTFREPREHRVANHNSTLFCANLTNTAAERDVTKVFAGQDGYRRVRFSKGSRDTMMAFVEYADEYSANSAMVALQSHDIPGSTMPGGLRIEIARNRMGMPSTKTWDGRQVHADYNAHQVYGHGYHHPGYAAQHSAAAYPHHHVGGYGTRCHVDGSKP